MLWLDLDGPFLTWLSSPTRPTPWRGWYTPSWQTGLWGLWGYSVSLFTLYCFSEGGSSSPARVPFRPTPVFSYGGGERCLCLSQFARWQASLWLGHTQSVLINRLAHETQPTGSVQCETQACYTFFEIWCPGVIMFTRFKSLWTLMKLSLKKRLKDSIEMQYLELWQQMGVY